MSTHPRQRYLCLCFLTALALTGAPARGEAIPTDWQRARDYHRQGRYREALEILADYQNTTNPAVHEYLAAAYEKTGRLPLALEHWRRSVRLHRQRGDAAAAAAALVSQAQVLVEAGRPGAALALLEGTALPLPAAALGVSGNAHLVAGDYESAASAYERLLDSPLPPPQQLAALNNLRAARERSALRQRKRAQLVRLEGDEAAAVRRERLAARAAEQARRAAAGAAALAAELPPDPNRIRARLAWLPHLPAAERPPYLEALRRDLETLPPDREAAHLWLSLAAATPAGEADLERAAAIAREIGDDLTLSRAWESEKFQGR